MMLNQNTISYQAVSDDPWMPAHVPVDDQNSSYIGDFDLNLLGCAEQHQICNPNRVNGAIQCTQLSGALRVQLELASTENTVGLNIYQQYAVNRILGHADLMNMFNAVFGRGAAALNGNILKILLFRPDSNAAQLTSGRTLILKPQSHLHSGKLKSHSGSPFASQSFNIT